MKLIISWLGGLRRPRKLVSALTRDLAAVGLDGAREKLFFPTEIRGFYGEDKLKS